MQKTLIWMGWLALAALNWAALHDILKGEPNAWMEWTVGALSLALVAVTLFKRPAGLRSNPQPPDHFDTGAVEHFVLVGGVWQFRAKVLAGKWSCSCRSARHLGHSVTS
jgi:hypothetical protein